MLTNEANLIDKLLKIEALYIGAQTIGEKEAAKNALDKVQKKIEEYKKADPPTEWKLVTNSMYEKKLLQSLLRRYGFKPFRYKRQKYTTVMVVASGEFINNVLWPEYVQMSKLLISHLDEVTEKIIKSAINESSEEEIRDEKQKITYH